jgi:outer membrane receptor for ferrienterochelin and colicins
VRLDWQQGPWRSGLFVEHSGHQLLPAATPGAPAQEAPSLTLLGAHVGYALSESLDVALGVRNLGDVSLAEKSRLFTQAEAPRTVRLTMRGRW